MNWVWWTMFRGLLRREPKRETDKNDAIILDDEYLAHISRDVKKAIHDFCMKTGYRPTRISLCYDSFLSTSPGKFMGLRVTLDGDLEGDEFRLDYIENYEVKS